MEGRSVGEFDVNEMGKVIDPNRSSTRVETDPVGWPCADFHSIGHGYSCNFTLLHETGGCIVKMVEALTHSEYVNRYRILRDAEWKARCSS